MKWWPCECKPGDIIRVPCGTIYHFGVYISDDEIIEFGPPPVKILTPMEQAEIQVMTTNIEGFAQGKMIEVGKPDKHEFKKKIPVEKIIEKARSRIGEKGYNLLHNNCEHFAFECVFGEKRSDQENAARKRWNTRPVLDVAVARIPEGDVTESIFSETRKKEIATIRHEGLKKQKTYVWFLLEKMIERSFGYKADTIRFKKHWNGRWTCDKVFFSISHTEKYVSVAVSNRPVGIDIEEYESFEGKKEKLKNYILTDKEKQDITNMEKWKILWTKKEAIFKWLGKGYFKPSHIESKNELCESYAFQEDTILSICGDHISSMKPYEFVNGVFIPANQKTTKI